MFMWRVMVEWPNSNGMVQSFVLTEKMGIKAGDFRKIKDVVDENADIIINRWNEYFNK